MKKISSAGKFLILVIIVATTSSCNKGVGCPMDFSVDIMGFVNTIIGLF